MAKHKKTKKHDDAKVVKKEKLQPAVAIESTKVVHESSGPSITTKAENLADQATTKAKKLSAEAEKTLDTATTKAKKLVHEAEVKIDEVTAKAKTYIEGQGKQDFAEIQEETVTKVNSVSEGVEKLGEGYEDLVESIFPDDHTGPKITYNAERKEDVDRRVVIRMLWTIVLIPVMAVWSAWISLIWIIFMVKIIMTGKRDRMLWDKMIRFANYVLNWDAYMGGLIDRRPEIVE